MWERARNFWNRIWNTAAIGPRIIGTGLNTVTDAVDTVVALPKDALDVVKNTTHAIKDVFVDAWTKWKWYQRVGNILLSPLVAAWTALEWAVRAAVVPVVNWVVNTWNTAKNTVTNTWRSTFGRVFSKKPLSDFSYDKLKTANFINKDKNWFSGLQFGKKKWVWTPEALSASSKKTAAATWAAVAWTAAATAAAAAAASSAQEVSALRAQVDSLTTKVSDLSERLKNALENNDQLQKRIQDLIDSLQKDKSADKPAEKKSEWKGDGWKPETKEEKPEKKEEKKEVKDADRHPEKIESRRGKKLIGYLRKKHPEIKIVMDKSSKEWHLRGSDSGNKIIVWTKDKNKAPLILLHEIVHLTKQDGAEWVKELENNIIELNEKYGKQLFPVSCHEDYDTKEKRAEEDLCETIAMFAKDDWSFEKHMEKLQSGENEKLAKISSSEAEKIEKLCKNIEAKTINMYDEVSIDLAA